MDKTGLTGKYDFVLEWTPDPEQTPGHKASGMASPSRRRLPVVPRFSPRCKSSSDCG